MTRAGVGPVVMGRGDRRPFDGISEVRLLQRIARYGPSGVEFPGGKATWADPVRRLLGQEPDAEGGGRFHPVAPGALAEVPRIYVFVHGWAPGSRGITEELRVEAGTLPLAWDERIATTVGRSLVEAYEPLLAALAKRDPQAAVLWYSWVDQSGTDTDLFAARRSLRYTGINGRRLGAALCDLIGGGEPKVQLIGHSHGCVVAANAALSMVRPPEHLTLLDCPEDWFSRAGGAAGLLGDVLPRLRPGRGPGRTFVDAYASMFGRAYHDDPGLGDVVDTRLAPVVRKRNQASAASQAHQFPVSWYTSTVSDAGASGGFAWSPLHGFDTATLGSLYIATAKGRLAEVVRWHSEQSQAPRQTTTPFGPRLPDLTRREPDVALVATMPPDANLVEYEMTVTRPGRDTRVDIAVDGHLTSSFYPTAPMPSQGRFVRVAPGRVTLQFRLVDGGVLTAARVSGVRVVQGSADTRNLDDSGAIVRVAAISAGMGAAAALSAVAAAATLRRISRRLRGRE